MGGWLGSERGGGVWDGIRRDPAGVWTVLCDVAGLVASVAGFRLESGHGRGAVFGQVVGLAAPSTFQRLVGGSAFSLDMASSPATEALFLLIDSGTVGFDVAFTTTSVTLLDIDRWAVGFRVSASAAVVALLGLATARSETARRFMSRLQTVEASSIFKAAILSHMSHLTTHVASSSTQHVVLFNYPTAQLLSYSTTRLRGYNCTSESKRSEHSSAYPNSFVGRISHVRRTYA